MTLAESYRSARSLEAVENYARAGHDLTREDMEDADVAHWPEGAIWDDEEFWWKVLANPRAAWGQPFSLSGVALSMWVARVPGLFWSEGAQALRQIKADAVEEYKSDDWVVLRPEGKSRQVLGGISTLNVIGVPAAHWFTGAAGADSSVQLLQLCVDRGKVEELLDAVAFEHPDAFL